MNKLGRILMVEDDPKDVELTLTAIDEYHGREVLDYLYRRGQFSARFQENPAVIPLDLKLAKVDGLEVLQQIKSDERLKAAPAMVLTSSHEEKDVMRSYKLANPR